MAKQGRAGVGARRLAALGSFFAGCVATLVIAALGAPLTKLALLFGPAEYFSLMVMGLCFAVVLARGSILKAFCMIMLGLLLSTVGTDLETGAERMTFGIPPTRRRHRLRRHGRHGRVRLRRSAAQSREPGGARDVVQHQDRPAAADWNDIKQDDAPILRGTAIGAILGILPGNGAVLGPPSPAIRSKRSSPRIPSALRAGRDRGRGGAGIGQQRRRADRLHPAAHARHPAQRGDGADGRRDDHPRHHPRPAGHDQATRTLFWGMIASMWIGNLMLLVINLPLVGIWVKLLQVPYRLMFPAILIFCCIGIYSVNNQPMDVAFTAMFGLFGYILIKLGFEPAPMLLGIVLGKLMEEKLRQALIISRGSFVTFVSRPISAGLLAIVAVLVLVIALLAGTVEEARRGLHRMTGLSRPHAVE
jgi:putative tricarboxylic transport membrane protein